ncbi:MAG: hypothetical protein A2075_10135 [Geobacteraceae bacterium GWC2_58_44]|nr:MAG: hypothetical protein A2075_10135 [Geobacteraceae bacterium GWC2_58_44]HBG06664.1 DUF72 domain-containing protein [Geobacter sp.]
MAKLSIGCSGFSYRHWRGPFYPEELSQKEWFTHYSRHFSTVELNVTFYRTPTADTFRHWFEGSAAAFSFAVKGSRYITHVKRLQDIETPLDRFFTPARELKEKLQVVLWQFPPLFKCNLERLESFVGYLEKYRTRSTLEFRNESWICPEVIEMCKARNISLCMADWPPYIDETPITADFVYIRRHGMQGSYDGSYSTAELEKDAARIRGYLKKKLDVFIYFNNDAGGAAPNNAMELAAMLEKR